MRPIFEYFPDLVGQVPHQSVAMLPTPVEPLPFAGNAWIKRDDLTHTEYGGNKVRKLEFIIAQARAQGAKRVVTFGAIGTNHGVATAMMCNRFGLACTVYLFDQPVTPTVQQNLRLMQYYEADLAYTGSLFSTVLAYYLNYRRLRPGHYFLFAGGSNPEGTLGYISAALELKQQIEAGEMPCPEVIVCPVGSSATLAGLSLGCQLAGLNTRVLGVRVAPSHLGVFPACTSETVYRLMRQTHQLLSAKVQEPLPEPVYPVLTDDYYGNGYGVATDKGWAAQAQFEEAGIKLEQTYTAKAAAAFLDQLQQQSGPVLYWHTFNSLSMKRQASSVSIEDLPTDLRRFVSDQQVS